MARPARSDRELATLWPSDLNLIQRGTYSIVPAINRNTPSPLPCNASNREVQMKVREAIKKGAGFPLGCLVTMLLASVVLYYSFCPEGMMPGVAP